MTGLTKSLRSGENTRARLLRPDIQGLRALAVIAVILDHSIKWPAGGFVGVDVFFVISGFLITGLLLRQRDRTGTISFSGFYRRRIRRIIPAAITVLASTVIGSFLIFTAARAHAVALDALWGLFFAANWHFAAIGTDYFQAGSAISPLQHVWSLAVEEQFYLVWPWLMLLIIFIGGVAGWSGKSVRIAVGIAIGIIIAASLIWAFWESKNDPTWAYFSTFSRAWELGLGAFLAVIAERLSRIPIALRTVIGWVGLGGIVASFFLITSASTFPAPWALAPVLATASVIAAGTGGEQKYLWPLTNPVAGFIGDVSYSLYLWHFPVIILLGALLPAHYLWLTFVLTALLSVGTFFLIEDPIRRSNWLAKKKGVRARSFPGRRPTGATNLRTSPMFGGVIILLAVCVLLGSVAFQKATPTTAAAGHAVAAPTPTPIPSEPAAVDSTPALSANTALLRTAIGATAWPDLSPSVDSLGPQGYVSEWSKDNCIDVTSQNVTKCVYGKASAPNLAVVIGDSHAISFVPAIRAALDSSWRVQILTMGQCPVASVSVILSGGANGLTGAPYPACDVHRSWSFAWIASVHPDLVFMTDATSTVPRIASASTVGNQLIAYKAGTAKSIDILSPLASKIILITSPPPTKALQTCKTALSIPSDCEFSIDDVWTSETAAELAGVDAATNHANVKIIDTRLWFCVYGVCPAFVGTTPQYTDGSHLTETSSTRLAPILAEALAAP